MLRSRFLAIGLIASLFAGPAAAEGYPSRLITLIVPYAAGGSTDSTARLVAEGLSAKFKQPVIVENRPGAAGTIGQDAVARAKNDGYTLLFSAAGPLAITPSVVAQLPYKPFESFRPIKLVASSPLVLLAGPKVKAESVDALIAEAKKRDGGMTYGSFGNGSISHLMGERFKAATGAPLVHVPYKGSSPALNDLIGGHIDIMFDVLVTGLPQVKGGKLRALAVTSAQRSKLLPEVPTTAEANVKDFMADTWFGLLAPAGTEDAVIATLSSALDEVIASPSFAEALNLQGAVVRGGSPEDFAVFFKAELAKWKAAAELAGIKPQ